MTPLQLFALICVLAIARVALAFSRRKKSMPANSIVGSDVEQNKAPLSALESAQEYLDAFVVAGLVALFMITFVVRTFYIPSLSMVPTLQVNDVLLANEFEYRFAKPHAGDIVVFTPAVPSTNDYIKRLIGTPGDTLRITNGIVYRNGTPLLEPYEAQEPNYNLEVRDYGIYVDGAALDPSEANVPPKEMWSAPDRIPDNCYFMMGDNRNDSADSHIWGFAQLGGNFATGPMKGKPAGFTGRAFVIFWPAARARVL